MDRIMDGVAPGEWGPAAEVQLCYEIKVRRLGVGLRVQVRAPDASCAADFRPRRPRDLRCHAHLVALRALAQPGARARAARAAI